MKLKNSKKRINKQKTSKRRINKQQRRVKYLFKGGSTDDKADEDRDTHSILLIDGDPDTLSFFKSIDEQIKRKRPTTAYETLTRLNKIKEKILSIHADGKQNDSWKKSAFRLQSFRSGPNKDKQFKLTVLDFVKGKMIAAERRNQVADLEWYKKIYKTLKELGGTGIRYNHEGEDDDQIVQAREVGDEE